MPTTLPGLSVTKAAELLQTQDQIIKIVPGGRVGLGQGGPRRDRDRSRRRLEMFETVINLKPKDEWRPGMTIDKLIAEMDKALQFPGVCNAWTMPIKARIDMLSTGIRTPVGVKVFGTDLAEIEKARARDRGRAAERCPARRSAYAERVHRRLLSRHRSRPRAARALRPDGRRRAGRDRHRRSAPNRSPRRSKAASATRVSIRYPRDFRDRPAGASPSEVLVPCRTAAPRCRSAKSPRSA